MKPAICRHCRDPKRKVNRPRGLCWRCFKTPAVRDQYPSTSKFAPYYAREEQIDGDFNGGYRLPRRATAALPGTPEKAAALSARVRAGVSLWHPDDARRE